MSIYIQITNRCNMKCEHCCFSCTSKGSDMTESVFKAAIKLARKWNQMITIGGGEPTLHPKFQQFLLHSLWELADFNEQMVNVITNGSNTELSLKLARLAASGSISAAVSQDDYHDPIDPKVYAAFKRNDNENDFREIRNVTSAGSGSVIPAGRAKKWGTRLSKCACSNVFIVPSGNVYACACKRTKLGNVINDVNVTYNHFCDECELTDYYKERMQEQ